MDCSRDRLAVGYHSVLNAASFSSLASLMFQSYLPEELWDPARQSEVEKWLNENITEPLLRKEIYLDWCSFFGIRFSRQLALNIGAEKLPPP